MTLCAAAPLLAEVIREFLAPPPLLTVSQWAEANRVLSGKDSAEPGPYRVSRTPYAREPMDCLGANSRVRTVVLLWGAQTSKTTVGTNWLGYLIDTNPGPLMVVWPTISVAKRNSRQRLASMVLESAVLRRKVRENRSRDSANTMLLKEFAGGMLAIAGANSAADLRSMPVRDLFLDEIDNYPMDVDGEGEPCQLAEARQTTYSRAKTLKTSTPTTRDTSRIEAAYLDSDRCRYHVPCPHCEHMQPLDWGADKPHGIKWDRTPNGVPIPQSVRYVCVACGGEIGEYAKPRMLAAGRWVAENPGAHNGAVRGFQLSSLYSPLGWLSWQSLVVEWHAATHAARNGDVSLLRVFLNTRLAETFEETGDRADDHALRRRAGRWPLRQLLPGMYVATLGVDVQGDRLEAYLWAWGRGMERQMLDRAILYGDPSRPETEAGSPWQQLSEYRAMPVLHSNGRAVPVLACFVDSGGHHTQAVYAYTRAWQAQHVHAVKGASESGKAILGKPTYQDISWRGESIKRGVRLWSLGTDTAKAELYGRFRLQDPGPGYVHLTRELPDDVFDQLTAERIITRYVRGHPKLEWIKPPGRRNEALDCAVYALAAAHYVGIDRWREGDWRKWQQRLEGEDAPPPPIPAERPMLPPPQAQPAPQPRPSIRRVGRIGARNPWGPR
jgi:phage terminase large subunit GpA-like protein